MLMNILLFLKKKCRLFTLHQFITFEIVFEPKHQPKISNPSPVSILLVMK